MKAVVCHEFGPFENLALEELPDPVPGEGQALVEVEAAGVNFPDCLIVAGKYQVKPPTPFIPGGEIAGIVRAVGPNAPEDLVGKRVAGVCRLGAFAEKIVMKVRDLTVIPDEMPTDVAAGLLLAYCTSAHALYDKARLQPGETLLVLGAAGGVGLAAVEIGKAMGAKVIAAASSEDKIELLKSRGADVCINYKETDLKSEVKRMFPEGIDVVYDPVGGPFTEAATRCLGWGGRLLVVGFAHGEIPKLPINLLLLKEGEAIGVNWGPSAERDPEQNEANVERLLGWYLSGQLRPHIDRSLPLRESAAALDIVMNRQARGKIVIGVKEAAV